MRSLTSQEKKKASLRVGKALRPSFDQPQPNRRTHSMGRTHGHSSSVLRGRGLKHSRQGGQHPAPFSRPLRSCSLCPPPSPGDSSGVRGDSRGTESPWLRCSRPNGANVSYGNSLMGFPSRVPQGDKSPNSGSDRPRWA